MKRIFVTFVLVIAIGLAASSGGTRAQEPTPEAGPEAKSLLPEAKVFGKGWVQVGVSGSDRLSADVFREGAIGFYGGPHGARITIIALLITEGRVAIRQSWEDASSLMDNYRYRINTDYSRESDLEVLPAPAHCAEAKRSEGTDTDFGFDASITMCAVDPDKIVIAVVSGEIDGPNSVDWSDWVTGVAIVGADFPRPAAAPADA